MDHNLSYRGPIWVIQNPNINFSDAVTNFMKDTSLISLFSMTENQPKIWIVCRVKTGQPVTIPENGP